MGKRKRVRLTDEKASFLGLDLKKKGKDNRNSRYVLDSIQLEKLKNEFIESVDEFVSVKNENKTSSNDYKKESKTPFIMSAWDDEGFMMDIDQYCKIYGLPKSDISTYKLISHTGTPFFNIVFKEKVSELENESFDYLKELKKQVKELPLVKSSFSLHEKIKDKEGVITLTDFHFGSYISAMKINPDFNITILCEMLNYAAEKVNGRNYKKVHIHLLGDLIESFTGLSHKNTWKGLDKGMFGVSAVKLFVELFQKHFLNKIDNLGKIKLVAGNHDRLTSDNKEDVDGGAAELISWGLKLLGYNVEFSTSIITHKVQGVNYILNHGHLFLTKKLSTQEICWKYGEKGVFNFITEGHLHSRIAKLNANQVKGFSLISDDNVDCRRQVCPSLFTGNSFSEYGGWSTTAGFIISESSRNRDKVDIYDISI